MESERTPVLIVGAGPIGLAAALLLDQQGVASILVDKKPAFDDHPRARFMDSCTLELFRQLGVAEAVEVTGIGPDWTEVLTIAESIAGKQIARLPSPEFHSVPRPFTPQIPVMTSQDVVETILYHRARACDGIEVQLNGEIVELTQDDRECRARIRDVQTGALREIVADYVIGSDGVRSFVRAAIGAELQGEVRDTFFRDVLFCADLRRWIDDLDRKGALLLVMHAMGAGLFQPLDGEERFRVQIGGIDPDTEIDDDFCKRWIWSAIGAGEEFEIDILSKRMWRVSARAASTFRKERVLLAGDAAQVFTPTGGMGLNSHFVGVRNLAWKLAYVVRGVASPALLQTYETEWKPQSLRRSTEALANADYVFALGAAYTIGGDLYQCFQDVKRYTHYTGTIFGYEIASALCERDPAEPPTVPDAQMDYAPVVRSGRRAPHVWLDEAAGRSILDLFGRDYVVVLGEPADAAAWTQAVADAQARGFPIRVEHCTTAQLAGSPYDGEAAIVVRPDLVVAAHARADDARSPGAILDGVLPS